jgi:hypothetical protein
MWVRRVPPVAGLGGVWKPLTEPLSIYSADYWTAEGYAEHVFERDSDWLNGDRSKPPLE